MRTLLGDVKVMHLHMVTGVQTESVKVADAIGKLVKCITDKFEKEQNCMMVRKILDGVSKIYNFFDKGYQLH